MAIVVVVVVLGVHFSVAGLFSFGRFPVLNKTIQLGPRISRLLNIRLFFFFTIISFQFLICLAFISLSLHLIRKQPKINVCFISHFVWFRSQTDWNRFSIVLAMGSGWCDGNCGPRNQLNVSWNGQVYCGLRKIPYPPSSSGTFAFMNLRQSDSPSS